MSLFTATVDDPATITVTPDPDGLEVSMTESGEEIGLVLFRSEVRQLRDALTSWLGEG